MDNRTWLAQQEIDILIASGFAELDEAQTERNKAYYVQIGGGPGNEFYLRPMYRWTAAGKDACHLYRYTTPMAYAEAMRFGNVRHCVHCGRCTARQKVGARHDRGSAWKRNQTVCLSCHAAGRELPDL